MTRDPFIETSMVPAEIVDYNEWNVSIMIKQQKPTE
jgi:hypothetical protein